MTTSFKELIVWQKSIDLVEMIYRLTAAFPDIERYGLTSQLRRAAVALPSNIAEGAERETTKDFLRFLSIARGSHGEVETQLIIALRLGYLKENDFNTILLPLHEVGRLINGLQRSLTAKLENA